MNEATIGTGDRVGVRELKNNLSRYLSRARGGETIIVTDHGRPVARLMGLDAEPDRLASLIASGAVTAPRNKRRRTPSKRIRPSGSVSDLATEQRR